MSDLMSLYQDLILDHYKHPRNFGALEGAQCLAEGHNPLCGDRVKIYLRLENGEVAGIAFEGAGCAISTASASLMSEAVKGRSIEEVEALFRGFQRLVKGESATPEEDSGPVVDLGKLEALGGVAEFPVRIKCATLAWHALRAALANAEGTVSTE